MTHTPIEITVTTGTSVYDVLVEARKQWGYNDIIQDILAFCADQPDLTFETKLSEALQKFKEANE
jgi:hypothetical protein